jgi:hypothetical protein
MRLTPGSSATRPRTGRSRLGLLARRRLEARFVSDGAGRPELTYAVPHHAVAAGKAALLDLAEETPGGQGGIVRQALAQIWFEPIDEARRWRALLNHLPLTRDDPQRLRYAFAELRQFGRATARKVSGAGMTTRSRSR